jgi:hypothetical protein
MTMNTRNHQRGMTAIGWLLVLGLIAFCTLITLRLVPMYLEYAKVVSTLESLENEPGISQMGKPEIVKIIGRRFDVNDVRKVDPRTVQISKERGQLLVGFKYERREHLVGNIDIVGVFDKTIEVPIR